MRLNLHDYDTLPLQFRDYNIKSGRVTFKVPGEFEIDLTVADEDPEKQFWFIDFRFLFAPTIRALPPHLRFFIESRVNATLLTEGLPGCYKFLHEMVLTHKISEFRRQAVELGRSKWVESLKVEALNRSVSIQYWMDRYGTKGPKSWLILGVSSGRRKDGRFDAKSTSHLAVRWFRDGKEVKDADIQFDTVNLSAEDLLKTVVAKHITHILGAIHEKLQSKPLFASNEMALSMTTPAEEPTQSVLNVQVTSKQTMSVSIEPVSGRFIVGPGSIHTLKAEYGLNSKSLNPAVEGNSYIELLRCETAADEITSHGLSVGWARIRRPDVKADELKAVLPKDTLHVAWFQRAGWRKEWYIAVSFSMGGDRWWLLETYVPLLSMPLINIDNRSAVSSTPNPLKPNRPQQELKITSHLEIPIRASAPVPTYNFLSTLGIFAAALVSHYANLKALHGLHAVFIMKSGRASSSISLPSIFLKLSHLLPSKNKLKRTGKPWAKDIAKLTFQGLELSAPDSPPAAQSLAASTPAPEGTEVPRQARDDYLITVTEARIVVPEPETLSLLKENVDQDIAFHPPSGTFACRLKSKVGDSVIPSLIERAIRIERLVEFVEVLHKHGKTLQCESISLGKIVLLYGPPSQDPGEGEEDSGVAPLRYRAVVDFGAVTGTMTITFEKGNPHLLIADRLAKVLNGAEGLAGVAQLLPFTLPALRALDSIEEAWSSLSDKGEVFVYVRAVEWYRFSYHLVPPAQAASTPAPRKVTFDLKLQQKKGEPWWYIRRVDQRDKEGDDIDALLKTVWNSSGEGYRGMRVNAVAQPDGAEELLHKLDGVIRAFLSGARPNQTEGQVLATSQGGKHVAPIAPMAQSQPKQSNRPPVNTAKQRQQSAQNQTQGQGKGGSSKMEVVEID
jgi:mediator of RNA polymerase II transcription subunit 14